MAYEKTVWKNRNVERPKTFSFQENADGTVTLISAEGVIYEAGTPVVAETMNKIEDQLAETDLALTAMGTTINTVDLTLTGELTLGNTLRYGTGISEAYADTLNYNVGTMRFYAGTLLLQGSSQILFKNTPRIDTTETGLCGIGIYSWGTNDVLCQVGVNFRLWKTYVPSSISFSTIQSNRMVSATSITQQGFVIYLMGEDATYVGSLYWRGYYTA